MLLRRDVFRRLCLARDLLYEVPERSPSIEDVAREIGISPFHFIRQFEAVFGATPHQFRIRSRLDRARHLLALGEYSVTEVCMEVGFSSLGSFSDLFTRRIGTTPSAYRRRLRAMVQVPGIVPPELIPGCLSLMGRLPPDAFSQFSRSIGGGSMSDSCPIDWRSEGSDENQTDQHHGRRSEQGGDVLHGRTGFQEEARVSGRRVQVADRRLT
jgi:AraC-like DNA-binding protein